jgi:peptide deformylase
MTIHEIITLPHPTLRRKAHKVKDFGPGLQTLIDDMVETMRVAPGVGLAATQINISLRVIVVEYGDEDDEEVSLKLYTIVNPEISHYSAETVIGTEACLSVPGIAGEVERPEAIIVKGFNRHGQALKIKADGWLARIFQHEIDHLDGVLFVDRATKAWEVEGDPTQVSPTN